MLVSQLSSTLPSSAGGGGKGSPSSPGKNKACHFSCTGNLCMRALCVAKTNYRPASTKKSDCRNNLFHDPERVYIYLC